MRLWIPAFAGMTARLENMLTSVPFYGNVASRTSNRGSGRCAVRILTLQKSQRISLNLALLVFFIEIVMNMLKDDPRSGDWIFPFLIGASYGWSTILLAQFGFRSKIHYHLLLWLGLISVGVNIADPVFFRQYFCLGAFLTTSISLFSWLMSLFATAIGQRSEEDESPYHRHRPSQGPVRPP